MIEENLPAGRCAYLLPMSALINGLELDGLVPESRVAIRINGEPHGDVYVSNNGKAAIYYDIPLRITSNDSPVVIFESAGNAVLKVGGSYFQ